MLRLLRARALHATGKVHLAVGARKTSQQESKSKKDMGRLGLDAVKMAEGVLCQGPLLGTAGKSQPLCTVNLPFLQQETNLQEQQSPLHYSCSSALV